MTSLLGRLDGVHPREVPNVTAQVLGDVPGVAATQLWLLDQQGTVLRPFGSAPESDVDVTDSVVGTAVTSSQPVLEHTADDGFVVHLALRVRNETVGVLSVTFTSTGGAGDGINPDALGVLEEAALALGYVLAGSGAWSDHVPVARRVRPMTLPAELQWSNLPLQALAGDRFSVAGKVLPTYEVGGDLFDISWGPRGPWVAVFDGVGHGLRSSLLAHAAVGTTRHARRCGHDLVGQAEMADRTLLGQFGGTDYVTAVLAELDVAEQRFVWVNAGHPPPMLLRDGAVHELARTPQRPLGLLDETAYVMHSVDVRAGDRLVLVSDGVVEARRKGSARGPFGRQRLQGGLLTAATQGAADVVREVVRLVDDWTSGSPRDDATVVVVDVAAGSHAG